MYEQLDKVVIIDIWWLVSWWVVRFLWIAWFIVDAVLRRQVFSIAIRVARIYHKLHYISCFPTCIFLFWFWSNWAI